MLLLSGSLALSGCSTNVLWLELNCVQVKGLGSEWGEWIQGKVPVWSNLSREVVWQAVSGALQGNRLLENKREEPAVVHRAGERPERLGGGIALWPLPAPPSFTTQRRSCSAFSYLSHIGFSSFCEVEEAEILWGIAWILQLCSLGNLQELWKKICRLSLNGSLVGRGRDVILGTDLKYVNTLLGRRFAYWICS